MKPWNRIVAAFITLFLLGGRVFAGNPGLNWLVNGDFKTGEGWGMNVLTEAGPNGLPGAALGNPIPAWKAYEQSVRLPQPPPPAVEVSGWMKSENVVKGVHDWEMSRITVVFFDAAGKQTGGWPASVGELQGIHDWEFHSNQYPVPPDAASVKVSCQMDNCSGKAWYAGINLIAYDFDLKPLAPGKPTHPNLKPAREFKTENWLMNPDFETPGSSDWGQSHIVGDGHDSPHCLFVSNDAASWNLAGQDVSFQGKQPATIVYGGWIRTEKVVRGAEDYMAARLGVDFRDAANKQVGGWQDSVCRVTGTTDWTYYEKKFKVPAGSAQVHVDAGLGDCVGKAWFDDLALSLLDAEGRKIPVILRTEQATDQSDWYPFRSPSKASDAPLDLSFLSDKPAGIHGFVTVRGGHFVFEDGVRVRFWGTDGVGPKLFLGRAEAEQVARRMAQLGINMVRLHFLDNNWGSVSLFDPNAGDTQTFLSDSLDKLDYLIAAFKKNGIYVYPDWSVGRKFRPGDGVAGAEDLEEGAKTVIHFSRKVIELNKKYARALLTHVNPYTGLALKDDPVYVGNEIVNESSIFCGFGEQKFPQPFWDELQGQYEAWGGRGKITRFKFDWDTQKLVPTANPENRDASLRFLLQTVVKSNLEMKAFLRKLSPHALLTGSNMGLPVLGNIKSDSVMDFMDTHAYWDHPQIWNIAGGWGNVDHAPFNNTSQLTSPFQGSLLFNLSHAAVEGKPLIVTEWNDCFPNEYRIEGPVLMAAYASLQDWDGALQFDYGPSLIGSEKMNNFDINTRPDNEPLFQAGALIFREGLLKPSEVTVVEPIADAEITTDGSQSAWLFDHPWLPYAVKTAKRFTGTRREEPGDLAGAAKLDDPQAEVIRSSTGEETLDYGKGVLKLEGEYVKGFTGSVGTGEPFLAKGLALTVDKRNPWVSVLAVSLDHRPIVDSDRILVVASARAENSGQTYNAARTALKDPGHTPVMMQGVKAKVSLDAGGKEYTVTPLDEKGKRGSPVRTKLEKGILTFSLSPTDHTPYYLVEKAGI